VRRSSRATAYEEESPVTLGGVLVAARRLWPLALVGLLLTALAAVHTMRAPGRYESSASYVLLPPASNKRSNALLYPGANLITAAGVLSAAVADPPVRRDLRSGGVRDTYTITLHNEGNQNADNFDRPVLDLFVYGTDPHSVEHSMTRLAAGIDRELARRQTEMRIGAADRIRTDLTPAHPPIVHGTGSPKRAAAATTLLGLGITAAVVIAVTELRERRRRVEPARQHSRAGAAP
jgi:hypothetical protein